MSRTQSQKADELRDLNQTGIYVLPNAWDVGSAVLTVNAGARVVATTSAGVSWAKGRPDGQQLTREQAVAVVREIAAAVDVPVSADIESGYGPGPEDVAETVRAVIEAGAVGINLEDGPLDAGTQAGRIRAARAAAGALNLQINARTDVYLSGSASYDETLHRAKVYAEAGADTLFVPGLTDLAVITKLVADSPLPVNIMVGPGAPSIAELAEAGVRRVSLGATVAYAAYSLVVRATREVLQQGTYTSLNDLEPWSVIDGGFSAGSASGR